MGSMLRRYWLATTVTGTALLLAVALYLFALSWRPSTRDYPFQGIDVSDAAGAIDWPAVKASGADFAYVVATLGGDGRDARFEENWRGAAAAGLRRGAIHVWSPCRSAADQASNFDTTVPLADDALPPAVAIDLAADCTSPTREAVVVELRRFIAAVELHVQRPLILLVSRPADTEYRLTQAIDRPVWSTRNFLPPDYAARPWRLWRASNVRRIDGVPGPVHWDVVAK